MSTLLAIGQLAPLPILAAALAFMGAAPFIRLKAESALWPIGGAALLFAYLAGAALYLAVPAFLFDHVEPQIAAVAYRALAGAPLYHAPDSAEVYALLYGPLSYLQLEPFYALLGAGLFAAKLPGLLALVAALLLTYTALRRLCPAGEAIAALGAGALVLATYEASGYWIRPDPSLMLAAALPLPWLALRRPWGGAIAVGLGIAFATGLKAHGAVYLLAPLALLWARHGWRPALAAVALAGVLAPAAYLAPGVSLADYLALLRAAARHGVSLAALAADLQQAALLAAPLAVLLVAGSAAPERRPLIAYAGVLILALALTAAIAAKPLAGPRHLMPFVPLLLYGFGELRAVAARRAWHGRAGVAWLATVAVMAAGAQVHVLSEARLYAAQRGAAAELGAIVADHPGTIEMGYTGKGYRLSLLRPLLVFAGHPYGLDAAALMDRQAAGLPLPPATVAALDACSTERWVLAKGEPPFEMRNLYPPHALLFDPTFIAAFKRRYEIEESREFFDVWRCRPRG